MTVSASVIWVLASLFSAFPESSAEQLAGEIGGNGIRRIGVIPQVLVRSGADDKIAQDLGPKAELVAQDVSKALADQSTRGPHKGKFSVVSHRIMRQAFANLSVKSLADLDSLEQVGTATKADTLLAIVAVDKGDTLELRYEFIPVSGDTGPTVDSQQTSRKTLSDFAYMGHSFEAQRVVNDRMIPVGLKEGGNYKDAAEIPLSNLNTEQPHPLLSEDFPYRIGINVEGRKPALTRIDQDLYVALNEGEKYTIQVWNSGPRPVFMALYIDGINTIGKTLESPAETTVGRSWCIDPSPKPANIRGYLTIDKPGESQQTSEEFLVARSDQSLAGERGFVDRLGMVTAVFYDFIPLDGNKSIPQIGTQAGRKEKIEIKEWGNGKRGVMLAAITLRYATPGEIETLRSQQPGNSRLAGGSNSGGSSTAGQTTGGGNANSGNASTTGGNGGTTGPMKVDGSLAERTFVTDGPRRRPANSSPNETGETTGSRTGAEPDESVPFPRESNVAARNRSDQ